MSRVGGNKVAKACDHGFDCCGFTTKHNTCKPLSSFCATCELYVCSITCRQSSLFFVPGKASPTTSAISLSQGHNLFFTKHFLGPGSLPDSKLTACASIIES